MASIATSLSKSLPRPKYTGEEEQLPTETKPQGPRVVDASSLDNQITLRRRGPPPYSQRTGWRPRGPEDYGDGGAFPEVPVAQYPLDMGRKTGSGSTSNALALQVDAEGRADYTAIARRGHSDARIVHSTFKDLIPLRQQANAGELSLERPSAEDIEETRRRTQEALSGLVTGATKAQNPKLVKGNTREAPTYVRYTPSSGQMGDYSEKNERIFMIAKSQVDPMEQAKFKQKKIPGRAPSPPPPVMHSPPRKVTAEEQENWRIPPAVSNWKNPGGYTVAIDKRLASNARGMQDLTINNKFAAFSEAISMAERAAREEVQQRSLMQQRLAEKEKSEQENKLRDLAERARHDRDAASRRRRSRSGSRSEESYRSGSEGYDSEAEDGARQRQRDRKEREREREREYRMSRMGAERRVKAMAREQGRDISEKVALGLAKPTASAESMYDSRLFNQSSGFASGFNEDQQYDKPLFAAQDAINSIYRPKLQQDEDDGEGADEAMERIKKSKRFGGFKDATYAEERDGPVQFEKDRVMTGSVPGKDEGDDPFGIGKMIDDVTGKGQKRYGMQQGGEDRNKKRARVESDEE